jgi:glycosyltransferase involved in cell wall biosynthesis
MPRFVSVITPTHNRRDMLGELLESLEKQSYPHDSFEVLVVDNSSTDGTIELLEQRARELPYRLRYFVKENRGATALRNLGLKHAVGDIIAFTDSDCVVTPEWIEQGVRSFTDGIGLVQGRTLPVPGDARPILFKTLNITTEGPAYETCNMFYSREALQCVGGFDEEFEQQPWGEDADLAFRVKRARYKTAFSPAALVYHQIFPLQFRQWLLEPRRFYRWPYLVRKHPELRQFLCCRFFLNRMTAWFDLGLVGLIGSAFLGPWPLVLILPFLVAKFREGGEHLGLVLRLIRVGAGTLRGFVIFGALLVGSVQFRRVLL